MKYDITVIGSGPGGYVAAIRCAQLGMKVAIIERYNTLGGTCLNVGCIPSKALLDSSEHYYAASHKFKEHGILVSDLKVDLPQMIKRKADVVSKTTAGVAFLMKKNKITTYYGHGSFVNKNTILISKNDGTSETIETDKVIIATGSKPSSLPGVEIDKKKIITSTEALEITELPQSIIVIGGGVIGVELGSVFARLGTKITVVEYADRLIAGMDGDLGKELNKVLKKEYKENYEGHFQMRVTSAVVGENGKVQVKAMDKNNAEQSFEADLCVVAVGRRPYTDKLGLENAGITVDNRGRIPVDGHLQTSVAGIYAIGDVIQGAMLAHKASEEGIFVAESINGQKPHINYNAIPGVVYTWPEVSGVGLTEEQVKANGTPYKVGKFPFQASGRARASMDMEGFVKIISHKETDEIIGMHIIGARAADMIMEGVMSLEFKASAEDLAIFSHPHPTFSESIKEAALGATGNRILHL
ncbi:MAG: dihydrolipoyl dehydrogenase [Bacteroidia bacterium]